MGAQVLQTCTPRPGGRWGPYSSDNLEIVAVSATVREIRIPENGRYNDGGPAEGRCSGIANPGGNTGSASNGWQNLFADVSPLRAGVPSALAVKWDADGTLGFNYDARSNDSAYTGNRLSVALPINGSSVEWRVLILEDDPQLPQNPRLPQVQNTLADPQTGLNTNGEYLRCGYAYRPHAENGARVPMSARAEDGDFLVDLYEGCHVAEIYGDDGVLVGTGTPVFDAVPDGWAFVEDWETDSNGIEIAGTRHKAGMTHDNGKSHVRWSVNADGEIRIDGFTVTEDDNRVDKATMHGANPNEQIEAFENIRLPFKVGNANVHLRVWDDDLIRIEVEGQPSQPSIPASVKFSTEVIHSSGTKLHTEWIRFTANGSVTGTPYQNGATITIVDAGSINDMSVSGTAWTIDKLPQTCARDLAAALRNDPDATGWDIEASPYCLPEFGTLAGGGRVGTLSGGSNFQNSYLRFRLSRGNNNVLGYGIRLLIYNADRTSKRWTVTIPTGTSPGWSEQLEGIRVGVCDYRLELWPLGGVPMRKWVDSHLRLDSRRPSICHPGETLPG